MFRRLIIFRKIFASVFYVLLISAIVGCSAQGPIEPVLPELTVVAEPEISANGCPVPTIERSLFTNDAGRFCLLFPVEFTTNNPNLIVLNPITGAGDVPGDAWVFIYMEPAANRTAAQVADEKIAEVGPGFNITRSEIQVDGKSAIVVDGLPGQDSSRWLYIVANDQLYMFNFAPWVPTDPSQPTPLEYLYTSVVETLHFLTPQ